MRSIVDHPFGLVVEACGCVGKLRNRRKKSERATGRRDQELHGSPSSSGLGAGLRLWIPFCVLMTKAEQQRGLSKSLSPMRCGARKALVSKRSRTAVSSPPSCRRFDLDAVATTLFLTILVPYSTTIFSLAVSFREL